MSAHTPGPWMVGGPFPGVSVCVEVAPADSEGPAAWAPVCIVDSRTKGPQSAVALADARLIAAAPDGLAAAKDMLESVRGVFGDDVGQIPAQWREQVRALRAFVAKAEGK